MRSVSISVTKASRNFADCINRARYQGTAFILHKNGVAVAQIVPVERKRKNMQGLDAAEEPASATVTRVDTALRRRVPEIW
jgi:antitoxin (DNA-binding transcriptional repressor) of toxin-antitoxin stability system